MLVPERVPALQMASGRGSLALWALLCVLTSQVVAQSPVIVGTEQELFHALDNDSSEIVILESFVITAPIEIRGSSLTSLVVRPSAPSATQTCSSNALWRCLAGAVPSQSDSHLGLPVHTCVIPLPSMNDCCISSFLRLRAQRIVDRSYGRVLCASFVC